MASIKVDSVVQILRGHHKGRYAIVSNFNPHCGKPNFGSEYERVNLVTMDGIPISSSITNGSGFTSQFHVSDLRLVAE